MSRSNIELAWLSGVWIGVRSSVLAVETQQLELLVTPQLKGEVRLAS
jgi:hypothetical protein